MSLRDEDDDIIIKKNPTKLFTDYTIGNFVKYNIETKSIIPSKSIKCDNELLLGSLLKMYRIPNNDLVADVLYKGFLLKDPLSISQTIKEEYIQLYIYKQFELYKAHIISKMPRIKKLKRLNLHILTRELSQILYNNLDLIIENYQYALGYENALLLKAQIVTTPFYVMDNNQIKIFHFDRNEYTFVEDEDNEANFLCYFTYKLPNNYNKII